MPTRPPTPHHDPANPQVHQPAVTAPPGQQAPPSSLSVTGPLLKDHAEFRERIGELRLAMDQFHLPAIRRTVIELHDLIERHTLMEECGLFLIGMKVLRADNAKIPNLIAEHHKASASLGDLIRALYSPRLTNVEQELRQLGTVFIDDLDHHLQDEEQVVFPALERLLPDELKKLVLERYRKVGNDDADSIERTPLISLPPLEGGSPLPDAGRAAEVFPPRQSPGPS